MLGAALTLLAFSLLANLWAPTSGADVLDTGPLRAAGALAAADVDARTEIHVRAPSTPEAQTVAPRLFPDESSPTIVTRLPSARVAPPATIVMSPSEHNGGEFTIGIRFIEPPPDAGLSHWPLSLTVESGEIRSLSRLDPDGFEWRARIAPQSRRSVSISLTPRDSCQRPAASCPNARRAPETGTRVVVAGPRVTASVVERPTHHLAQQPVEVLVELSEPVWVGLREIRDRAFRVTNGRVIGVNRVDGRHDLWRVSLLPDSGADLEVAFSPRSVCSADGPRLFGRPPSNRGRVRSHDSGRPAVSHRSTTDPTRCTRRRFSTSWPATRQQRHSSLSAPAPSRIPS